MLDSRMKRISFDLLDDINLVEKIEGVWYSRKELALIRRRDDEILKKIRRAEFREGVRDSARGLSPDFQRTHAKPAIQAVLQEQKRQQDTGTSNTKKMAELSYGYTKIDRVVAIENAFKDAIEASETRPSLSPEMSTFKLLAVHSKRPLYRSKFVERSPSFESKPFDTDILAKPRHINKSPSLQDAFRKTLRESKSSLGRVNPDYKLQSFLSERRRVSVQNCIMTSQISDGEETTELTVASYSSIDSF